MGTKRIAPTLLLIVSMFALAEYCGQRELIFPEIAALALGAWVMEKSPWNGSYLHFWLSPTLAALTGVLIVRLLGYSPLPMIAGAFCLVVLQLKLLRSGVLPSISAAILAIITRCDSWWYPLSVCVMTALVALGMWYRTKCSGEVRSGGCQERVEEISWSRTEMIHWARLLAIVTAVSALAMGSGHPFVIAPPLIVALIELSKPGGSLRERWSVILGLLIFAAFSGAFWFSLSRTLLLWPLWLSACLASLTVFFAYHRLRLPFPPALAIALLPSIVPMESLWSYPWQVATGSAAFIALGLAITGQRAGMPLEQRSSIE